MFFNKQLFESKYIEKTERVPIDTLFLIGNGFDIWQGFDTRYAAFEKYYEGHIDEVLKHLGLTKYILRNEKGELVLDAEGKQITYCDVELFYGDPYNPKKLPPEFWCDFETSLDKVDDQEINHYFGKTGDGLKEIQRCANNAQRILREIFSNWIQSIAITEEKPEYAFGDHCLFVNFNYTDTLLKRFGVCERKELHIHGTATERESIIFGHATHPEKPYQGLQMGKEHPRYQGLYYIEEFLYNSDKHVEDNFMKLRAFLGLHGVKVTDIKHVYVLGLGFGNADLGYIRNLINMTTGIEPDPEANLPSMERHYLDSQDSLGIMHLNIEYAASHRERIMKRKPISFPKYEAVDTLMYSVLDDPYYHVSRDGQLRLAAAAVRRRFLAEQKERDAKFVKEYLRLLRKKEGGKFVSPVDACLEMDEAIKGQLRGAQWHISYFSPNDKIRIESVVKAFKCNTYEFHASIDECIKNFKID